MMDIYKNWDVFISNIDVAPEQLDGEKLIVMVSKLSRTREERELLGKEAAAGIKTSLKKFLESYVPMIVGSLKKYTPKIGYNRDVLMNCIEELQKKVVNSLYIDNFEYNISHYISWMVRNEVIRYIAYMENIPDENSIYKMKEESRCKTIQEIIDKTNAFIHDRYQVEIIEEILLSCKNEREIQMISFRLGLEDGVPKTCQETADEFGISRERVGQIERRTVGKIIARIRRSKSRKKYLNDK
ncbi:RNA polymerase sigma factor SigB [Eubacteriaceae bacterium CHKCI004]|nr:RNA polymerase sigma factor SigB [Eubacteriaceae bacterium CHKCI004]